MIYVQGRIAGHDETALMTRSYLTALARVPLPIRAVWSDAVAVEADLLEPEFRTIYELGSRSPEAVQALLSVGSIAEVTARPAEAPHNVALTWWTPGRLTKAMRARLGAYHEVWVPSAAHQEDYPTALVIPIPFDDRRWETARERVRKPRDFLFYTAGQWAFGEVERVVEAFVTAAAGTSGYRLLVLSPDAPFDSEEHYRTLRGLPAEAPLPPITVEKQLPGTMAAVRTLHTVGDCYVGRHSLHAAAARAAGNRWVTPDGLVGLGVEGVGPRHAAAPDCVSFTETAAWMERRLSAIDVEPRAMPAPVESGGGPLHAILTFVIPHRDDLDNVKGLLESLLPQVWPGDEVVVSDQGSCEETVAELRELCSALRVSLVEDRYSGVWNIARARNAGFRWSHNTITMAPRYVMAVDADLRFPDGWVQNVRARVSALHGRETALFIPRAVDAGGARSRIASGASLLPRCLLEAARGWDAEYCGYGSEDLDLIHRLRHDLASRMVQFDVKDVPPLTHVAHPPRAEKLEYGRASLARLELRVSGRLRGANPDGWGLGSKQTVQDGELVLENL